MKRIIVDVAYTKTLLVCDNTFDKLQEENFSGQINILEEAGVDATNIHHIDFSHKDNKTSTPKGT